MSSFKFIIEDLNTFNLRMNLEDLILHWIKTKQMTPEDAYSLIQYSNYLMSNRKKGDSEQ